MKKHTVFLVPGFFGFANLGRVRYFGHVRGALRKALERRGLSLEVHCVRTHPTASLRVRTARLADTIEELAPAGEPVDLIGHSTGGLDARLLASGWLDGRAEAARRVRTVVSVAAPHRGTPLASLFSDVSGRRLLKLLSLATIHVTRVGPLPLRLAGRMLAASRTVEAGRKLTGALAQQLFDEVLSDFDEQRQAEIAGFFEEVGEDQALLTQLTPEALELITNSLVEPRHARFGSVVAGSRRPELEDIVRLGLDAPAQVMHQVFRWLHRRSGAGTSTGASDGIVPTDSQHWGTAIHKAVADHLDVLGHFHAPEDLPPHYDWMASGSRFTHRDFDRLWDDVAAFIAEGPPDQCHSAVRRRALATRVR